MLSQRVKNLKASPTLALAAKAKSLKAEGKDVISLSVGEPDWDTFPSVKEAAMEAIRQGKTKYTPAAGTPELRQAIANQTNGDFGTSYAIENVTTSSGGKFVLFCALQCLLNSGDEVIIPSPYWVSYPDMTELADGKPIIAQTSAENGFKLTPEILKKALSDKTKVLILNSPSNPAGIMYSAEEWSALGEVIRTQKNLVVISDDIYNRLVFLEGGLAPHLLHTNPDLVDRVLCVNGVSKTYSMTGWRLGWAVGPTALIKAMSDFQSQSTSCASSITQEAALQAITGGEPELKEAVSQLKIRRDFVYEELSKIHDFFVEKPEGAFYIWPNISKYFGKKFEGKTIEGSKDFASYLLEDQMVVAVPGFDFGQEGYLRVSYAIGKERMGEAIERIQVFLNKLN